MGYTTTFSGAVTIDPPLNDDEITYLTDFAGTRRMRRTKGPLFVHGTGHAGQNRDKDVIDHNRPHDDQPGLWCQWVPSHDGTLIEWDGGEKFYNAAEWMKYLVTQLLSGASARAYVNRHFDEDERLKNFTCNHVVNGEIEAVGEDGEDRWTLVVEDSVVKVADTVITYRDAQEI